MSNTVNEVIITADADPSNQTSAFLTSGISELL